MHMSFSLPSPLHPHPQPRKGEGNHACGTVRVCNPFSGVRGLPPLASSSTASNNSSSMKQATQNVGKNEKSVMVVWILLKF